jgi:hypothetical protein
MVRFPKNWAAIGVAGVVITTLAAVGTPDAAAGVLVYSDKATYVAATGSGAVAPLQNLGPTVTTYTTTDGQLTFTTSPPANPVFYVGARPGDGVVNNDWTLRLPGPDIAISGPENLNIDVNHPVFSLGYGFAKPLHDPNANAPVTDATFQETLLLNGVPVGSFLFSSPSARWPEDAADFVGVTSSAAFNRVEIRDLNGNIDNEFFNNFYTGDNVVLPEPGSLTLLGVGAVSLLGRAVWRRRR